MGGENLSLYTPCRALFWHRSPSREDTTRTVPHDLGDSALSTRPRPGLEPASTYHRSAGRKDRRGTGLGSFHRLVLCVTMVSRDGQPFPGHIATVTSTGIDKTSLQRHPGIPASSYPIKGQAGALQRGTTNNRKRETSLHPTKEDQHLKQSPLYSHLSFKTWARFPLSQLITPTQALRCKEIQYSSSPLDVGPSFARTRINLRVFTLYQHPD
jgi:hypothetical protein